MRALVFSGGASHGAFQAGVVAGLYQARWEPHIVCGASVGAINAVALASGYEPEDLCNMWRCVRNRDVYALRSIKDLWRVRRWKSLLKTNPLREFLKTRITFERLGDSAEIVLSVSTNIRTGAMRVYSNRREELPRTFREKYKPSPLTLDAVMASAAIPVIFPPVAGEWDGAFLQTAPIEMILELGATEIIYVAADYRGGIQEPKTIVEQVKCACHHLGKMGMPVQHEGALTIIAPERPMGYSRLNFSSPRKEEAIRHGKEVALRAFDGRK